MDFGVQIVYDPLMSLTLYRRHRKACTKGYPQNFRIHEPQNKADKKIDCECPIVVSGSLRLESKPVQHVSTETNDWEKAKATAKRWEAWEALTNRNPDAVAAPRTVDEVVKAFMEYHGPKFKDWNARFLQKFDQMFRLRLQPFCEAGKIQFIGRLDDRELVNKFVTSWRNMNPLHNRKLQPGETLPDVPLAYRTKSKELERLRYFSGWCVDSKYLKENHAKKIKLKYQKPDPKFGLLPHEVDRVFDTIEILADCYGRINQKNYQETYAFILVSRHTGLRINAVTNLDRSQLVPRESGTGHAIKVMDQRKTGWVRIPVPISVYNTLMALPTKGEKDEKQYWFRTGVGTLTTAITVWRKRQTTLFAKAQEEPNKKFEHKVSPHIWRHTFAISHLNAGADIKMVSRWCGHSNQKITEDHYGHANSATNMASDLAYDESLRKQEEQQRKVTQPTGSAE